LIPRHRLAVAHRRRNGLGERPAALVRSELQIELRPLSSRGVFPTFAGWMRALDDESSEILAPLAKLLDIGLVDVPG
jgi:hypothetical protein